MTPTTQTITVGDGSGRQGNCLQAAVASLLDLPLDDVPHFLEQGENWFGAVQRFAWSIDYDVRYWSAEHEPPEFGLALGMSVRGVDHCVVVIDGEHAWDPHPSRAGLESVSAYIPWERR